MCACMAPRASGRSKPKHDSELGKDVKIASGVPSVPLMGRILQVLCNLLSNALKFTPAHGSIVVRLHHVDDDDVCCAKAFRMKSAKPYLTGSSS
jgi:signal transduction histidine kinase